MPAETSQLSADDLMAPLPEDPRLGGPGPFVINLRTSASPLDAPDRAIAGAWRAAHVYQVQRVEDKRVRYRLRLGPFLTEDEAIAALAVVRQSFPAALTASADADDLRAIAGIAARTKSRPAVRKGAPPASGTTSKSLPPGVETAKAPVVKQTLSPPAAKKHHTPPASSSAAKSAVAGADSGPAPWYVVELAASDKPFTPAALPPLDVFSLYRLYSLASVDQGRTTYVLRLGFFSDEAAAATIAKYLCGHFGAPVVRRVSVAERERFAVQPRKINTPAAAKASAKR